MKSTPLSWIQRRLAIWMDVSDADRLRAVEELLASPRDERFGYWLQLMIAMGIATLGLVLGSTAVVIGAMLVSPLMTPIVNLGIGLAAGSPVIVLRSGGRVLLSVAAVVGSAALIALLLPFHEINSEIRARTSPNALDLLIATLCAFAAVYTTARRGKADASTAAGTAIGISLVPPLCVCGYGVGTWNEAVAIGAGLLFTANFSAIVFVASAAFWVLGYGKVGISALERSQLEAAEAPSFFMRVSARLHRTFSSSYGPWLRVVMPLLILGSVYVPLRRALEEVTWQVRVRREIATHLATLPERIVESNVVVDHHTVAVRLVAVGQSPTSDRLEASLRQRVGEISGVEPTIEILRLPDQESFRALASSLTVSALVPQHQRAPLASELYFAPQYWPSEAAGPLLRASFESRDDALVLHVLHLGAELGPAGRELLAQRISEQLGVHASVVETAVPALLDVAELAPLDWLVASSEVLAQLRNTASVFVCVEEPAVAPIPEGTPPAEAAALAETAEQAAFRRGVHAMADGRPNVSVIPGPRYRLRIGLEPCTP